MIFILPNSSLSAAPAVPTKSPLPFDPVWKIVLPKVGNTSFAFPEYADDNPSLTLLAFVYWALRRLYLSALEPFGLRPLSP